MFSVIGCPIGKQPVRLVATLLIFVLGLCNYSYEAARNEIRCGSIDIRNLPSLSTSSTRMGEMSEIECTIVEGDFTLSMVLEDNVNDDMFPVFHNLREITGAILIFQIRGLTTLSKMFPNLRVIGGYSLIMNYALVIYQNQDLRNIGLSKLSVIKNGGVRIAENSRLCYTRNIHWDNMIVGNLRDIILDTAESQCQDLCVVSNESKCYRARTGLISCWNPTECQTYCPYYKYENGTFGPGCAENGEMCHPYCLGGCTVPNDPGACHTCRNVEVNGICTPSCPEDMFEQSSRRCMTKEECHSLRPVFNTISSREGATWKAFNGKCHYDCPSGFEEDPTNNKSCVKCAGHCPKKCRGDESIDSAGAALKFRNCNIIDGYLEIEIRIGSEANAEKFSEAFGELEEITGYLMIRFSSVFVSLHMFRKLRVIQGNQLYRNVYALVVFDNQNLKELFNVKRQALTIQKGKVQFQNNRMLCYKKIEAFLDHIGKLNDVTDIDVSTYSNGDKAICDEVPLDVEVTFVYSYGFSIRWTPFNTSDMDYRKFIGYQIFYKKVDKVDEDLSIDEDRSACADTWKMQFTDEMQPNESSGEEITEVPPSGGGGALISQGIEANTLYAFYVQTRIVNHPGAQNAISKVHFIRTHFGNPDPPRIRVSRARGPDRLEIVWDPPVSAQGVITHYTVHWHPPEWINHLEEPNGCSDEVHKPIPKVLLSKKVKKPGTCSLHQSCCECSLLNGSDTKTDDPDEMANDVFSEEMELSREERDSFENGIQNIVFKQSCKVLYDAERCGPPIYNSAQNAKSSHAKRRRHLNYVLHFSRRLKRLFKIRDKEMLEHLKNNNSSHNSRPKRYLNSDEMGMDPFVIEEIIAQNETAFNISMVNVSHPNFASEFLVEGKINITGNRILITGLPHFTEYVISIYACQDIREPDNSCSARPAWVTVRTASIPENDMVPVESVHALNVTNGKENDRRFNWLPPKNPNGAILAYRVKLFRGAVDATPLFKCVRRAQFLEDNGIIFNGLAGGVYSIEVRTVTLAGVSNPARVKNIFSLHNPIMSKKTMVIIGLAFLCSTLILSVISYFLFKYYCQRMTDKIHQLLSSNPEYLSQIDVYKKDEWELPRDQLVLGKEIGSGTFGKVYRGIGRNLTAVNGTKFGECAVKTISEKNANMDRYHFLVEASVMKQFDTNFIVKLYGVVSDAPVLVVMELMERGNLRDFLRAHRPDSEENIGSRYKLPTADQYYNWAAQIADGMAYLESLRFCHRDLAARNCMVHSDELVKIGDFGMARDIYYQEYYKPQGRRLMPIRWLSPESLKDGIFTLKSDVWSFGVVLYEMITLGQVPYAGLANNEVFNFLGVERRVMARPRNCPNMWYNMMRSCWIFEPRDRPCFWQIVEYLRPKTSKIFRDLSFVYNGPELARSEGDFTFERGWPPDPDSSSSSVNEEVKGGDQCQCEDKEEKRCKEKGAEKSKIQQEQVFLDENADNSSSSCSCSQCSNDRDTIDTQMFLEPMQRRKIRNYLASIAKSKSSSGKNDMNMESERERDLDCLLPTENQPFENDYIVAEPQVMSDSFCDRSTAYNNSRIELPIQRRSIGEEEENAIRQAFNNVESDKTIETRRLLDD